MHHPLLSKKDFPPFFKGKAEIFISLILCLPQLPLWGRDRLLAKPQTQKNGLKAEKSGSTKLCLPWHWQLPLPQLHQTRGGLETPQSGDVLRHHFSTHQSAQAPGPVLAAMAQTPQPCHCSTDPSALSPRCPLSPDTAERPSLGSAREKTLSSAEPGSRKCQSCGTACEHHGWQHCPSQELLLPGPASRIVCPRLCWHINHSLWKQHVFLQAPLTPCLWFTPAQCQCSSVCPALIPLQDPSKGKARLVKLSPPVSQHCR